jgi:hypothetical protein
MFGQGSEQEPHSKSARSDRRPPAPIFRRCCVRTCIKRSSLLRLEKLAVMLLVGYALCDLLVFDLNASTRASNRAPQSATTRAGSLSPTAPVGCAFVRGVAVPPGGGPASHGLQTANVEDCCVACSHTESAQFYFDSEKQQCWCQVAATPVGSGVRRSLGSAAIVSGQASCCRAIADAQATNGTHYADEFARNYDIGDLNNDGMMSEQEFAQFHVVADANHDGMLTPREFRHWLGKVVGEDNLGDYGGMVTTDLLLRVAAVQSVPLIGFGFLDNCIMIVAGDAIDNGVGRALHISTMAAAGLGNLISDVAGLGLEDYVRLISDTIMVTPQLSREQKASPQVMTAQALGGITGISLGCLLGMAPLLLMGNGAGAGGMDGTARSHGAEKGEGSSPV